MLVFVIIYIVLCLIVGSAGSDRKIGFFSAFIFSLILSPLVGWLITLAYSKTDDAADPVYDDNLHFAMIAMRKGKMEEAYARINAAILRAPNKPRAYLRLGAYYAKLGDIDLAIKNIAKSKSLGVKSLEFLSQEPFDTIRESEKWKEFKANDYETDKPITDKSVSTTDELLKLGELLEKGLITREEFDAEKSKLLK